VIIIATFAIGATIVTLTIVAGEPALRLAAMAFFSFLAMWCVRAINGALGTVAFVIGMVAAFALSLADDVASLSRAPASLSATWLGYTPTGLTMPPEDVLVRFLLWLWLVLAMPSALVIVGHLLTGRDPARPPEDGVVSRLAAVARFCRGQSDAMSLPPGVDELVKRLDVAARADHGNQRAGDFLRYLLRTDNHRQDAERHDQSVEVDLTDLLKIAPDFSRRTVSTARQTQHACDLAQRHLNSHPGEKSDQHRA
jgi:hypothetical protein